MGEHWPCKRCVSVCVMEVGAGDLKALTKDPWWNLRGPLRSRSHGKKPEPRVCSINCSRCHCVLWPFEMRKWQFAKISCAAVGLWLVWGTGLLVQRPGNKRAWTPSLHRALQPDWHFSSSYKERCYKADKTLFRKDSGLRACARLRKSLSIWLTIKIIKILF